MSNKIYVGSTKWTAITAWAALAVVAAGVLRRQLATPTVGNERAFVSYAGGTTGAAEPTWGITLGAKTTGDGNVSWIEVTGQAGVNGNLTDCPNWTAIKNTAVAQGKVIQDNAGLHLFVVTTAGTAGNGSEPSWDTTAGNTTTDGGVTWTCLGLASAFGVFAAPHARLENAYASGWSAAGDYFYMSNHHAQTVAAALTLSNPGTPAAPCYVLCIDDTVAVPTAATTGATITTTGGTANITFSGGVDQYVGVALNCGTGSNSQSILGGGSSVKNIHSFENCAFNLVNTGTSGLVNLLGSASNQDSFYDLKNCSFTFGNVGQAIQIQSAKVRMTNPTIAATGSIPTAPFRMGATSSLLVQDADLSKMATNLYAATNGGTAEFMFKNCKLNSALTPLNGSLASQGGVVLKMHNCDNGSTNYKLFEQSYQGTITQETTVVRTGGAYDGTTHESILMASSANANFAFPLECIEFAIWNDGTGSAVTATVEITGAATLTNGDIWLDIDYLGDSATPEASRATSRKADVLTTASNVPTSTAVWATTPAAPQKLAVSFTPQQKGYVFGRVRLAKPSASVYIDPKITLS